MEYKLKFLQSALDDLDEIVLYIASDNKDAAIKMYDEIISKSKNLLNFPKLGRLVPEKKMREKGYRILLIKDYIMFYRIINTDIYVYRVLHGSWNYPILFNRIK